MTTRVSFASRKGSPVEGELAEPSGTGPAPAIVLVQEWWGVNDHIRSLVTRFSQEGFLVLAPDLYHGKTTRDPKQAEQLMARLDTLAAVDEIAGAVAHLASHPRSNGHVGVTGFCLGGGLTLATACHVSGIDAAVAFYGMPPAEKVDYANVTAPILLHVATNDNWVTVPKAEALVRELRTNHKSIELATYDAQHAFMNDTRPEVFSPEHAARAWSKTVAFFREHLA